ncbi:MAG: trypsin-like peptidase domain-containing protein, partial [Ignavibacteriae bacterium]|nr:trypsin-like peptidase domain-containing protein [Ignavibacteriota bacterium]
VVYPNKEDELVGEEINNYLNDLRYKIKKAINEKQTEQSKLVDIWNEYYDYLDYEKRTQIKDEYSNKKNDVLELEQLLEKLDFNPSNTTTELKRIFLGIAFDDTHVTSLKDFRECVTIKKANENDIDLAIIQLKDKRTPHNIVNTFSLNEQKNFENPKLNDNVYMIGFNHGISLANTDNGIKSQFTQGTITQDPDNKRILYSIPTLPGSSGSPIIDKWGNLIAINFAKTGDFQGFSFGIPSLALTNLYNNYSNIVTTDYITSNSTKAKEASTIKRNEINYENIIRDFLKAEENRDFDKIYSFFSPKFSRYYDIKTPNYSNLKNRYEYLWGFVSNSRNYVKSIDKVNEYAYDLNTNYKYYDERKKKEFSVNSTVRFLFDSNGKIIETYGIE